LAGPNVPNSYRKRHCVPVFPLAINLTQHTSGQVPQVLLSPLAAWRLESGRWIKFRTFIFFARRALSMSSLV
jgi:hypothetical protein